jgi:hypothetical protein
MNVEQSEECTHRRPGYRSRLLVAVLFAVVGVAISWRAQYVAHGNGSDHILLHGAAKRLLVGLDPYQIGPDDRLPAVNARIFYPLPGLFLGLPFVWLSPPNAAIAFIGCSAALLGFALTREGFGRVPLVFSVSFLASAQFAQSAPLIFALALFPATRALSMLKPNLGLAFFAWRPSRRNVFVAAAIFVVSLLFWPRWLHGWYLTAHSSPVHHAPAATGVGAFALLSILRWRRPEGRLLFAMSVVPHGLYFYDELPLWIVAQTRRESMVLVLTSWLGWVGWNLTSPGPRVPDSSSWSVAALYLPALVMLLRRPNVGDVPPSIERVAGRLPRWLRGQRFERPLQ